MSRTKEFIRAEVLQAALDTFMEKGFAATSIQDLVNATKINRQSLYNEFGDKRQLYIKALESFADIMKEEARGVLEAQEPARMVLEKYKNRIKARFEVTDAAKGCMIISSIMGSTHADPDVKAVIDNLLEKKLILLAGVIARGQQAGELPTKHKPIAIAQNIHSCIVGMSVMARGGAQPEQLIAILEVAFEGLV
ncbi:MAG: hypothetical protein COB53_09530 [Elusimicrobia bacterium]|nr:MAG: hypothetical protein COB53_09530 [Elusimicrobiota bacterium]